MTVFIEVHSTLPGSQSPSVNISCLFHSLRDLEEVNIRTTDKQRSFNPYEEVVKVPRQRGEYQILFSAFEQDMYTLMTDSSKEGSQAVIYSY